MSNPGLQDFLNDLSSNHPDEVFRVKEEVDINGLPSALALEMQHRNRFPVILLERLSGFDMPLVTNVFGSWDRILRLLGCSDGNYGAVWERIQKGRMKPVVVKNGPVKEVSVEKEALDVGRLPIPLHFQNDAGRYIAGGFQVALDPETGVPNLSYHRMQLKGKDKFGISLMSRGHVWDYFCRSEQNGKDLEMAVVIGAHPSILLGAVAKVGIEVDEYEIGGALLGEPVELVKCETIDVYVPASAEIVIEGRVLAGEREPEGPFGEYTGYSGKGSTDTVFVVTAMTRRKEAIFLDNVGGNSADHLSLTRVTKEMMVFHHLKEIFPELKAIHYPTSGVNFHCYLSMDIKMPGRARQALMHLFGLDHLVKLGIVVDADIDVSNEGQVLWSLATRVQARERVFVVPDSFCNVADPSARGVLSDKVGIDATSPLDGAHERLIVEPAALEQARKFLERRGEG